MSLLLVSIHAVYSCVEYNPELIVSLVQYISYIRQDKDTFETQETPRKVFFLLLSFYLAPSSLRNTNCVSFKSQTPGGGRVHQASFVKALFICLTSGSG